MRSLDLAAELRAPGRARSGFAALVAPTHALQLVAFVRAAQLAIALAPSARRIRSLEPFELQPTSTCAVRAKRPLNRTAHVSTWRETVVCPVSERDFGPRVAPSAASTRQAREPWRVLATWRPRREAARRIGARYSPSIRLLLKRGRSAHPSGWASFPSRTRTHRARDRVEGNDLVLQDLVSARLSRRCAARRRGPRRR